jgi:hypothetical protein
VELDAAEAFVAVRGDDLIAEYQDKSIKRSKKETDSAVTDRAR